MKSQLLVCWLITLGCFYHGKDSALFYGNRYTGYRLLPKLPSMGLEKALLIILIFYIAFNWAICFTLNAMWQWAHEYTLLVLTTLSIMKYLSTLKAELAFWNWSYDTSLCSNTVQSWSTLLWVAVYGVNQCPLNSYFSHRMVYWFRNQTMERAMVPLTIIPR